MSAFPLARARERLDSLAPYDSPCDSPDEVLALVEDRELGYRPALDEIKALQAALEAVGKLLALALADRIACAEALALAGRSVKP